MNDQFVPLVAMPMFWIGVIGTGAAALVLINYLQLQPTHIIGRLAMRSWKRPKAIDWARLIAQVELTGNAPELLAQMDSINRRFGKNTIRCGHLAVWWYMALGQTPWTLQLPAFANKGELEHLLRGKESGRAQPPQ